MSRTENTRAGDFARKDTISRALPRSHEYLNWILKAQNHSDVRRPSSPWQPRPTRRLSVPPSASARFGFSSTIDPSPRPLNRDRPIHGGASSAPPRSEGGGGRISANIDESSKRLRSPQEAAGTPGQLSTVRRRLNRR